MVVEQAIRAWHSSQGKQRSSSDVGQPARDAATVRAFMTGLASASSSRANALPHTSEPRRTASRTGNTALSVVKDAAVTSAPANAPDSALSSVYAHQINAGPRKASVPDPPNPFVAAASSSSAAAGLTPSCSSAAPVTSAGQLGSLDASCTWLEEDEPLSVLALRADAALTADSPNQPAMPRPVSDGSLSSERCSPPQLRPAHAGQPSAAGSAVQLASAASPLLMTDSSSSSAAYVPAIYQSPASTAYASVHMSAASFSIPTPPTLASSSGMPTHSFSGHLQASQSSGSEAHATPVSHGTSYGGYPYLYHTQPAGYGVASYTNPTYSMPSQPAVIPAMPPPALPADLHEGYFGRVVSTFQMYSSAVAAAVTSAPPGDSAMNEPIWAPDTAAASRSSMSWTGSDLGDGKPSPIAVIPMTSAVADEMEKPETEPAIRAYLTGTLSSNGIVNDVLHIA